MDPNEMERNIKNKDLSDVEDQDDKKKVADNEIPTVIQTSKNSKANRSKNNQTSEGPKRKQVTVNKAKTMGLKNDDPSRKA